MGIAGGVPVISTLALILFAPQWSFQFYQLDMQCDGVSTPNSNYGMVEFDYQGAGHPLFLNVVVQDGWVVENIPLVAPPNAPRQLAVCIPLPVLNGQDFPAGEVWFSITPGPLNQQPPANQPAQFNNRRYHIDTGVGHPRAGLAKPRPLRWINPDVFMDDGAPPAPMPNGETGTNECCPQSILNAIEYFRSRGIPIPPEMLTLLFWKSAVNWQHNPNGDPTAPESWDSKKKNALRPVKIKSSKISISEWPQMPTFLKNGCCIEMGTKGHVMNVVGVVRKPEFQYSITVSHDTDQGTPGGLTVETLTFDVRDRILAGGGKLTNGQKVQQFVLQCPEQH